MNHVQPLSRTSPVVKFDPSQQGVLDGIRVLDLSRLVAGNMLSLQLADFGADVIKVEPTGGDPLRHWRDGGHSLYWKVYGRNKRSIALNLRQAEAREALLRLIEGADILVENFRPGTLEKMGLAPDLLHERNPDLIIIRISGFGQTGPYAGFPGFGTLVEAMSGFAARTGFPDREPVLPPLALADMIAGLYGALSALMALRGKDTGRVRGQVIDLSLLEPMFSILGPDAAIYRHTGKVKQRVGSGSQTSSPRNVYRCADGNYVALSGSTEAMAKRILALIGRSDMIDDPRFADNAARIRNRAAVDEAIGCWFAARNRNQALQEMRAADVTVAPVYNIDDIVNDAHFRERQVVVDVEDEELGVVPMHNILPRLSSTPGTMRRPAPALGQHTNQVLAEAGFSEREMLELRRTGAAQ